MYQKLTWLAWQLYWLPVIAISHIVCIAHMSHIVVLTTYYNKHPSSSHFSRLLPWFWISSNHEHPHGTGQISLQNLNYRWPTYKLSCLAHLIHSCVMTSNCHIVSYQYLQMLSTKVKSSTDHVQSSRRSKRWVEFDKCIQTLCISYKWQSATLWYFKHPTLKQNYNCLKKWMQKQWRLLGV